MLRDIKRLKSPPRTVGAAEFLKAAEEGNLLLITTYISERGHDEVDMNVMLWNGRTALMLAAGNGHTNIVSALLAVPAVNINADDVELETALNFAAYAGHVRCVRLILAAGCLIPHKEEVLKIIEDNNHLTILDEIKRSTFRLEWINSLKSSLNLSHELIGRVIALSPRRFEIFSEIIAYFIMATKLDDKNFIDSLNRAENRLAKIRETTLQETKSDSHFRYDLANNVTFFLERESARQGEFSGNNGYVCKAYLTRESAEPAYAVKWVRDPKIAQHEAKHNTCFGSTSFWFHSSIPHKRVGILYPWKQGCSLESLTKREIINLPWLARLRILISVLRTLDRIHANLYVHNDIKPANIVVNLLNETAEIIDYGSTRRLICKEGYNKDIFGLEKITSKLAQTNNNDNSPIKIVFTRLLTALKQSKSHCVISSEQALAFCVEAENQYRTLNEQVINNLAARILDRAELTQEDIIRGRYIP